MAGRALAPAPTRPPQKIRPWLIGSAAASALLLAVAFSFVSANWPYRYRKIKPLMEEVFGSQVSVVRYHRTYFPHPGFMATGLTLRRKSALDQPPFGSVDSMMVQGSWIDLFTLRQRVQRVEMTGVHLVLPAPGSRAAQEDFPPGSSMDFTGPDTFIEQVNIHNSLLDVLRVNGRRFSFPIRLLHIENMQKGRTMKYDVDMDNAIPFGHLHASGNFGPLSGQDLGSTTTTGDFTFNDVRLHDVGNIRGTLTSKGHFAGRLDSLQAEAATETPDFAVSDGRPIRVDGEVRCAVNGLNGDAGLQSIDARMGSTNIHAAGSTAGSPKVTHLDITVRNGRAQDLLRPFLRGEVPITGAVALRGHVFLSPSGNGAGFFDRLHVDGAFDIPAERATDPATEKNLTDFSKRALDKKPEGASANADAVSSLKGAITIRKAIVSTHGLAFTIPGANAKLDGTFNLHTTEARLAGILTMQEEISHTVTGFKSFLLKPLDPFFKKKKAGAVIPIAVVGTSGHYRVTQAFTRPH